MSDPNRNAGRNDSTDPRFDNWPVEDDSGHQSWGVERRTPDTGRDDPQNLEWIGVAGSSPGSALFYSNEHHEIRRGRVDHENQQFVVEDEEAHRSLDEDETLGDHLVEIGDEHGWNWLSSFAHDHLETHEHGYEEESGFHRLPPGFDHRQTEFQRRNVADSADVDVAFHGSHTFADETDRVHVLEREFGVDAESEAGAVVTVKERYLVAEEPRAETREGDADLVDRREYEFTADFDTDERDWDNRLEGELQKWHEAHLAPPLKSR